MKRTTIAALALMAGTAMAQAQNPAAGDLNRRMIERRAVEAVIWGMPAVNTDLMLDEMVKTDGKPGQVIYWGQPLDWRNQTLTPNPPTRSISWRSSTPRLRTPSWSTCRRPTRTARSTAISSPSGRPRWKTPDCSASIRARASNSHPAAGLPGKVPDGYERLASDLRRLLADPLEPEEPRR